MVRDSLEAGERAGGAGRLRRLAALSLRARLALLITLVFTVVLGIGAAFVIGKARESVVKDVLSTADLTLQIIALSLSAQGPGTSDTRSEFAALIDALHRTRHLDLALEDAERRPVLAPRHAATARDLDAPAWFVRLVEPGPLELRRPLALPGLPPGWIVARANPDDEIDEAWAESWPLLALLLVCLLLSLAAVHAAIGGALRPVAAIEGALAAIETGDYGTRLPALSLPELDVIARRINHMAGVLQQSRADNRALVKRGLALQEEERRYLAQELHDEMGQSISAIKAVAVAIAQRESALDPQVRAAAQTISDVSGRMYGVVRAMMRRLRPAVLDELGLTAALMNMIDEWNTVHEDVFCALSIETPLEDGGAEVEIGLYRIVQECLTNVARHAQARRVEVRLTRGLGDQSDVVELDVRDDGRGIERPPAAHCFGLRGVRERVEALGGTLVIESAPGQGTAVRVRLPVHPGSAAA